MANFTLSAETLSTTPTKDLLAWYNANSGAEPVKRFADRAAAEKRVAALLATLAKAPESPPAAPKEKAPRRRNAAPQLPRVSRAEAVKASWSDRRIHAARAARHAARVDGTLYESVRKAFIELGLDLKKHQRVRADLVKSGSLTFEGHKFLLAPKE